MNTRRPFSRDQRDSSPPRQHGGSNHDDFYSPQMGEDGRPSRQFGSRSDWRGDWDVDSREDRNQMGAGDDRFGGYIGSHAPRGDHAARHERGRPVGGSWDEDRFGQPEPVRGHGGSDWNRGARGGYGLQGRFGNDWQRHAPSADASIHGQYGSGWDGHYERNFGQDFGPSFNSHPISGDRSWRAQQNPSGSSFAGDRGSYGGRDRHVGYGIPSGSEPGGYGMNDPYRGSGERNWSGSNWGNDQTWRGSGSISSDFGRNQGFGGRAPKGYTRSDERIKDDVCERLYHAHEVDVSNVSVELRNGTVTLEGTVPNRAMKHRIEDLCEHCIGVNDVDNRIRVAREGQLGNEHASGRGATDDERVGSSLGSGSATTAKKGASSAAGSTPGGGTAGSNAH